MKVRYTPRAQRDLADIFAWLDERSPKGARSVKRAIKQTIDLLGRFPNLQSKAVNGTVCAFPVAAYPYLIYWTWYDDAVVIIHVRHAQRER